VQTQVLDLGGQAEGGVGVTIEEVNCCPQFHIAEEQRLLENAAHYAVLPINREVTDGRLEGRRFNVNWILQFELPVKYFDWVCLGFDDIVVLTGWQIDNFTNGTMATKIVHLGHSVLIRDFGVCWWYYLVLLEHFVLIPRLLRHPDVLNDILRELRPLKVAIPVNVHCLEELD
jgi:hypothetical protein